MYFDLERLDGTLSYKLMTATIVPRPIAWLVTANAAGKTNAAPFSFFNAFSGSPAVICVGIGQRRDADKDSLANIRARGEFVVNLVSEELVEAMSLTSVDFPPDYDELQVAGLATEPSVKIGVPRIARSPVSLECTLQQVLDVGGSNRIVVAGVAAMHILDEAVINPERCHIDTARLKLVGRMQSPGGYVRTTDTFKLKQTDFAAWRAAND